MLRRFVFSIAASLILVGAPAAAAQTAPLPPPAQSLSTSDFEQRLAADGFRVLEIERYPNSIEVKGYDRAGQCMELHLDPRTGDTVRRESDDDCSRSGSFDDNHRRHGDQ